MAKDSNTILWSDDVDEFESNAMSPTARVQKEVDKAVAKAMNPTANTSDGDKVKKAKRPSYKEVDVKTMQELQDEVNRTKPATPPAIVQGDNQNNNSRFVISASQVAKARKRVVKKSITPQELQRGSTFDIARVKEIGVFEDVMLFGTLDCYRENSQTGMQLDGKSLSLSGHEKHLISGLCRLKISVEGRVTKGIASAGVLKRRENHLEEHMKQRIDERIAGFIGYEDKLQQQKDTQYFPIAYLDCDVLFDTGTPLADMYKIILDYTDDDEELLLDMAALDLVQNYGTSFVRACCMAISRVYVDPLFRGLGLSAWLLRNLPVLGQTVVNMPVGDMLLIPGDFSGEAKRRNMSRLEYTEWLSEYYIKNGFQPVEEMKSNGIYRNKRLNL